MCDRHFLSHIGRSLSSASNAAIHQITNSPVTLRWYTLNHVNGLAEMLSQKKMHRSQRMGYDRLVVPTHPNIRALPAQG